MISNEGKNLVFILSTPRAGSTLLNAILGSHSAVYSPPEPWFLLLLKELQIPIGPRIFSCQLAKIAAEKFLEADVFLEAARNFAFTAYNKHLEKYGKSVFIDKTPRYYHILDFIDCLFPKAKKIFIKRNPLDVAASYKDSWGISVDTLIGNKVTESSFDLTLGIKKLIDYFDIESELKFQLKYEDLVQEPEINIKNICRFLDLTFEPDQMDFINSDWAKLNRDAVLGDKKIYGTKNIHKNSVGRWKTDLKNDEISLLLGAIGLETFDRLGYSSVVNEAKTHGIVPSQQLASVEIIEEFHNEFITFFNKNLEEKEIVIREQETMIREQETMIREQENSLHEHEKIIHLFRLRTIAGIINKIKAFPTYIKRVLKYMIYMVFKTMEYVNDKGTTETQAARHTGADLPASAGKTVSHRQASKDADLRISIVTPTYNHARYIETTVKSVLSNTYKNIEYIIVDGASTDNTKEIVSRYRDRLTGFISERDEGQADAVNKGFKYAQGDIFAYINSDDYYFPYTFERIAHIFAEHPEIDIVYGDCVFVKEDGQFLRYFTEAEPFDKYRLCTCSDFIMQPTTFFRREAYQRYGGFDKGLHYGFDWDLWCKMAKDGLNFYYLQEPLAVNRAHKGTKTATGSLKRLKEIYAIVNRHKQGLIPHAIFSHILGEAMYNMKDRWYKSIVITVLRALSYKNIIYNIMNEDNIILYGVYPYSNRLKQRATIYLPWYAKLNRIRLRICVPWLRWGSQELNIKLNEGFMGNYSFCKENKRLDILLDTSKLNDLYIRLGFEFSRTFGKRYAAVLEEINVS